MFEKVIMKNRIGHKFEVHADMVTKQLSNGWSLVDGQSLPDDGESEWGAGENLASKLSLLEDRLARYKSDLSNLVDALANKGVSVLHQGESGWSVDVSKVGNIADANDANDANDAAQEVIEYPDVATMRSDFKRWTGNTIAGRSGDDRVKELWLEARQANAG